MNSRKDKEEKVITVVEYDKTFTMPGIGDVERLLKDQNVADLPVMVLVIIGKCRTGKSFLLNYILRYLRFLHEQESNQSDEPLGDEHAPLDGFPWTNNLDSETKGILMWNHVFKIRRPDNKEVAVVIMDTQGLFDRKLTENAEAAIFTLCVTASSFLLFNMEKNISSELLRALEKAIYGKLMKTIGNPSINTKSLGPELMFLVRDWKFPRKHSYGLQGGETYLRTIFGDDTDDTYIIEIKNFFKHLHCFLMPYPGDTVSGQPNVEEETEQAETEEEEYNGNIAVANRQFKTNLKKLSEEIFTSEHVAVKHGSGHAETCKDIYDMLEACPLWMNEALTSPVQMMHYMKITATVKSEVDAFKEEMRKIVGDEKPHQEEEKLKETYERLKTEAKEEVKKKIAHQFQINPDHFVKMMDEENTDLWSYVQIKNMMKTKKAVLASAVSIFNDIFKEALSYWSLKSTEDMRKLKKKADNAAMEFLRKNLKGDVKETREYMVELRQLCNLRYKFYLNKNTWMKMVKRGTCVAGITGMGVLTAGLGVAVAFGAGATTGGLTAVMQNKRDSQPNQEEADKEKNKLWGKEKIN